MYICTPKLPAEVAQLVEHDLAKVGVASSSLVFRSQKPWNFFQGFFIRNPDPSPLPSSYLEIYIDPVPVASGIHPILHLLLYHNDKASICC